MSELEKWIDPSDELYQPTELSLVMEAVDEEEHVQSSQGADVTPRRILIVDDNVDFTESLRELLVLHDYAVEVAHNEAEALERATHIDIQVAIVDLRLKDKLGTDLLPLLKQVRPHLLSIILTGCGSTDSAIEALRQGAHDFLRKPASPEVLLSTLEHCFERISLRAEKQAMLVKQDRMNQGLQQVLGSIQRLTGLSTVHSLLCQTLQELQRLFRIRGGCVYFCSEKQPSFRLLHTVSANLRSSSLPALLAREDILQGVMKRQQVCYFDAVSLASTLQLDPKASQLCEGVGLVCSMGPIHAESHVFFVLFDEEVLAHKQPYQLKLGNVLLSYCSEASRLVNALGKLQHSRTRLEDILDMAPDGIVSINAEMQIIQINRAAERMFGYSSREVMGRSLSFLMPKRFRERHDHHVSQFGKGSESQKILEERTEMVALRKNGEEFPVEISISKQHTGHERIYTSIIREVTDRVRAEKKLQFQAYHDSLTGLPNRQFFEDKIRDVLAQKKRFPEMLLAVLFIDLDQFKYINDSMGHSVGDALLEQVAKRLLQSLRDGDVVARWGGDEFVVLLNMLPHEDDAIGAAERIIQVMSQPFMLNDQLFLCSASIGIAFYRGKQEEAKDLSYNELLRNADIAMYRAKELGRARYVVFGQSMYDRVQTRMVLEKDLRQALKDENLELYYQPILELKTAQVAGFEALLRWEHPTRGWISPGVFIPLAEESELIIEIDQWVLRHASLQLQTWHKQYPHAKTMTMSINLSAKHFALPHYISDLIAIVEEVGVDPDFLKLEITEGTLLKQSDSVTTLLKQMKDRNLHLCLDDFGTGYSSLSYLGKFPIDILKIDRSFVCQLKTGSEQIEVVRAIITLAHSLGMKVVAEGVETLFQMAELEKLSCEYIQGFFVSAPVRKSIAANFVQQPIWQGEFRL